MKFFFLIIKSYRACENKIALSYNDLKFVCKKIIYNRIKISTFEKIRVNETSIGENRNVRVAFECYICRLNVDAKCLFNYKLLLI